MTYVNPHEREDLQGAAAVLAALGHPVRLRIVAGLLGGACCVGPMIDCLGIPQPLVSRHLAVLRAAHVVDVQREGRLRRYHVVHPAAAGIVRAVLGEGAVERFAEREG